MDICTKLKTKNLLEFIEMECGTEYFSAGGDTIRYKKCPICMSGDHFTVNTKDNYYNSFGNACGAGSIIDFHMNLNSVDIKTAIKELSEYYDIPFNSKEEAKSMDNQPKVIKEDSRFIHYDDNSIYVKPRPEQEFDDSAYFTMYEQELRQNNKPELENADQNIISKPDLNQLFNDYITVNADQNIDYFVKRLLNDYKYSDDTIVNNFEKIIVNYKMMTVNPKELFKNNPELLPKLPNIDIYEHIIPVYEDGKVVSFILRANNKLQDKQNKTMNLKGIDVKLFNSDYLKQSKKELYITEGIFDCLSLECLGFNSICLNSVNMYNKLVEAIKVNIETCKDTKFILCLDNDKKGIEVSDKLKLLLTELNIKTVEFKFNNENVKDLNEYYLDDLDGLKQDLEYLFKPKTIKSYLKTYLGNQLRNKYREVVSTGFERLDECLNGGFYPGLYVIGAISSLGKTALTLQIADNIAKSKKHVLFFSLEMPTDELISRTISRKMANDNKDKCKDIGTMRVLNGYLDSVKSEFENAFNDYSMNEAEYLSIIEGNFSFNIDDICKYVSKFVLDTGIEPVVFIDYLQIIKGSANDKFGSEKEKIDNIVVKLKMLSRDCNIPVLVVSSFNRESYESPVSFACFKESGGIEYTADFVLGLQLSVLDTLQCAKDDKQKIQKKMQIDTAKKGVNGMREVTLKILKNRNGESNTKVDFSFKAKNNMFEELKLMKEVSNDIWKDSNKNQSNVELEKLKAKIKKDEEAKLLRTKIRNELKKEQEVAKEL